MGERGGGSWCLEMRKVDGWRIGGMRKERS
jgi:hypothetical protein